MSIQQVVDSVGTELNQYTLKHTSDNTEEEVLLTFHPSEDYEAGTPFNAATMNPMVGLLNGLNDLAFEAMTVSEYEALVEKDQDKIYFLFEEE